MADILRISLEDRQKAWKFQHGEVCMGLVTGICENVLPLCDGRQPEDIPTFYGQILSIHALYGRPFKQRDPYRLSTNLVPSQHANTHASTIKLRDKLFAHMDQDTDGVRDDSGDLLGKMIVLRTKNAFLCTMSSIIPLSGGINDIMELAQEVRGNCQKELSKVWSKYPGAVEAFSEGSYEINIEDPGDAPMLRKLNWA